MSRLFLEYIPCAYREFDGYKETCQGEATHFGWLKSCESCESCYKRQREAIMEIERRVEEYYNNQQLGRNK